MYAENRQRLLDRLADEDMAAILPTGSAPIRNNDCEYRFRPDSDFWYVTGFAEPDSVLVLRPGAEESAVLFLRQRNRAEEIWTGKRLGTEAAPEALGVDAAYPIEELWSRLPELLTGYSKVMVRTGLDAERDRKVFEVGAALRAKVRGGVVAPQEWRDPGPILGELRLRKTAGELELMRRAAAITAEAHAAAMRETAPGKNEAEIDALLDYTFRRLGGIGQAYTNIVAGGANACILHYVENDAPLADGELLLIDAGCELDYYASDVTRTFPVGGRFSAEQRAVYDVVLRAQKIGIEQTKPGNTFASVHDVTTRALVEGMIELGWLSGPVDEELEKDDYKRFFMHRTGHWLGIDVHDCGAYHVDGESRALEPGMITTVEPGLYVSPDEETVEARWRGIGVRIEDDIAVTETGNENLTAAIPKEADEVEAACGAAAPERALEGAAR